MTDHTPGPAPMTPPGRRWSPPGRPDRYQQVLDAAAQRLIAQQRLGGGISCPDDLIDEVARARYYNEPGRTITPAMRKAIEEAVYLHARVRGMPDPDGDARARAAARKRNGAD